jgi:hypothetical protein
MARIAAFLAMVGAGLAAVAALNWWLDPLGDQYHGRFLTEALGQPRPCMIAWGVLRPHSWGPYKLDLASRADADVVVAGTSRVAKVRAWPNERGFVNVGAPGEGADSLEGLFARLHERHRGKLTVYVGADLFWFGEGWRTATWFDTSYLRDLKYLLSPGTTGATFRLLRRAPGAIRHPQKVLYTEIDRNARICVVDRGNSVLGGASAAWAPDGSLFFQEEIKGKPRVAAPLIDVLRPDLVGARLSPRAMSALGRALTNARAYGWTVVGFAAPFAPNSVRRLGSEAQTKRVYHDYRARMPGFFRRYGFRFLDFTDVASIPCAPEDFSPQDEGHPDAPCSMRIRRKLDAAAGVVPRIGP